MGLKFFYFISRMCYRNSFHIFKIRWDFIRNHNIRHLSFQDYCSGFYLWYCLERGDSLRNHSINFSFDFYLIYCCYWKKGRKGYESCKKLQVLRKNNFKLLFNELPMHSKAAEIVIWGMILQNLTRYCHIMFMYGWAGFPS